MLCQVGVSAERHLGFFTWQARVGGDSITHWLSGWPKKVQTLYLPLKWSKPKKFKVYELRSSGGLGGGPCGSRNLGCPPSSCL